MAFEIPDNFFPVMRYSSGVGQGTDYQALCADGVPSLGWSPRACEQLAGDLGGAIVKSAYAVALGHVSAQDLPSSVSLRELDRNPMWNAIMNGAKGKRLDLPTYFADAGMHSFFERLGARYPSSMAPFFSMAADHAASFLSQSHRGPSPMIATEADRSFVAGLCETLGAEDPRACMEDRLANYVAWRSAQELCRASEADLGMKREACQVGVASMISGPNVDELFGTSSSSNFFTPIGKVVDALNTAGWVRKLNSHPLMPGLQESARQRGDKPQVQAFFSGLEKSLPRSSSLPSPLSLVLGGSAVDRGVKAAARVIKNVGQQCLSVFNPQSSAGNAGASLKSLGDSLKNGFQMTGNFLKKVIGA
jgi:hypothetical protein